MYVNIGIGGGEQPSIRSNTRSQRLNEFLTPLQSGREVWNHRCCVDVGFLLAPTASSLPHVDHGCISEEVLDDFICNHGPTFLAAP